MTEVPPAAPAAGSPIGFKRHLHVEVVAGDATYLLSEAGISALGGDDLATLAPLLDGTRDVAGVVAALPPTLSPARAGRLLGQLLSAGYLRQHTPVDDDAATCPVRRAGEAYWDLAGLDGTSAMNTLATAVVDVIPVGVGSRPTAIGTALVDAGTAVTVHDPVLATEDALALRLDTDATFAVVVTDDYLHPALATIDRLLAAHGRRWLLARVGGPAPWIGPVFGADGADRPSAPVADSTHDDERPCWECLSHQLQANRVREAPLRAALGPHADRVRAPAARTPVSGALEAQLIALTAAQWIAGIRRPDHDCLRVHDTISGTVTDHAVRRRPQCRICGRPDLVALRAAEAITLHPRPKQEGSRTGHRSESSAATYARYAHLISPVTGVVPELRRDDRLPDGMHCYLAGHNPAVGTDRRTALSRGLRQMCGGKGTSDVEARTSALCEALERHSGQLHGDELRIRARLRDRPDALDPAEVMLFDPRQAATETVPEPLDPDAEIDWTPVWSFSTRSHVLLPTALLYFDHPVGVEPVAGRAYAVADSNGNAAGACLEDAIVQGFLELVERDAVALWWYNRTRRPGVDLSAFDDPWLADQLALHARLGRELTVLDVTSDLGVPVLVALSRRTGGGPEDICLGFGAHFDPAVALRRAVAEVAQLLPAVLPPDGAADGHRSSDPTLLAWWADAAFGTHPYLSPDPRAPLRGPGSWDYRPRGDLAEDVLAIRDLVDAHGMQLLVLDQTRPDVGLPVVKVIVPGLRHFWRRLAPGRLFDEPVRTGLRAGPITYADVNPVEMFL